MPGSRSRAPAGNLPAPISAFIGRAREIAEVKRLLDTHRLVTIVGPGGSGKTRLAIEVARGLLGEYQDGVWLVELAPLSDGRLIAQTVAASLGIRGQSGRPLIDTLLDHLSSRRTLLVLDNCEHLIDACTQFVHAALERCADLHVLATSRQTLAIGGEALWSISSLSLPERHPSKGRLSAESALKSYQRSEAVQLFVDRAASVAPDFILNADNGPWVAEICHRLDGLPLAIELAASRVQTLSARQIAERLDDRFRLLTDGNQAASPRQQTLTAALDWSYQLLAEDERKMFMRLSTFVGGATLSAAETVCAGDGIDSTQVLDLLSRLVKKSLLTVSAWETEDRRYRVLETIGAYAREKLQASGEMPLVLHRFLQFYLGLVDEAAVQLRGPEESVWYQRLEQEHDNVRAALEWALQARDADSALGLACGMTPFWYERAYGQEGIAWLERALDLRQLAAPSSVANASRCLSSLMLFTRDRDLDRIVSLLEESLRLYRQADDSEGIAWVLNLLGITAMEQRDYSRGRQFLEESLARRRELGDPWFIAQTLQNFAPIYLHDHDYAGARKYVEDTIAWFEKAGYQRGVARSMLDLADIAILQGDRDRALAWLTDSFQRLVQLGDRSSVADPLASMAELEVEQGHHQRAATLLGAAEALAEASNLTLSSSLGPHFRDKSWAAVRESLDEAALTRAWEQGRLMNLDQLTDFVLHRTDPAAAVRAENERWGGLTARERETALLIARGKSNREIAEAMTVSMKTVESYVTRILQKLNFDSRVQIATWVIEQDLN